MPVYFARNWQYSYFAIKHNKTIVLWVLLLITIGRLAALSFCAVDFCEGWR